jgi:hypothetical protein
MKLWTKLIFGSFALIALLVVLCLSSSNASAVDAHLDQDGWEWHYDTGTPNTLTKVVQTGAGTEITIPANLDGATALTTIGSACFNDAEGHKITKVLSMPNTITLIKDYAFSGCQLLTSVTLSTGGVVIQEAGFNWCVLLATMDLSNVLQVGPGVFEEDHALTSVIVGSGMTGIGGYAFRGCSALTSITFLGLVSPSIGANWIDNTPAGIRGHAYTASNFPIPGVAFNGLTMGTYIYMITSGAPSSSIAEDSPYYYNATANQAGYWTVISPAWLSINSTGHATGTPSDANVGANTASIRFNNSNGWSYKNWTLTVANTAPSITTSPILVDFIFGNYRYDANATDPVTWTMTCSYADIDIDSNGVVSGYLANDEAITVHIVATDASGGVAYQNYTITVHGPMTDLAPMMVAIIPVIALVVIVSVGISSIKRKR